MSLWASGLWAEGLWADGLWAEAGSPVAPTVTTTGLLNGTVNVPYSATLQATGDAPITWAVTVGALPTGLTLSSGGVIGGTPTTEESQTFTVEATNGTGSDTQQLTLTISAASNVVGASSSRWWLQTRKRGRRRGAGRLL